MGIRKIASIKSVHELDLDIRSARVVADHLYRASTLITAARNDSLRKLDGIGRVMEQNILAAVDKAGFIFHETAISAGMRELLTNAFMFRSGSTEETEQEVDVLNRRFGLSGNKPLSLRQTAAECHVSGERIRQVEAKALRKLRHPSRRKEIKRIFPNWPGFPDDEPEEITTYDGNIKSLTEIGLKFKKKA